MLLNTQAVEVNDRCQIKAADNIAARMVMVAKAMLV